MGILRASKLGSVGTNPPSFVFALVTSISLLRAFLARERRAISKGKGTNTMRVLVTGASGFVGSHVVEALKAAGHEVRGLSRTAPKGERVKPGIDYKDGVDVGDSATLKPEYFQGVEAVVHLVGIIQERGGGQTFQRIHVDGTRNVLTAAQKAGTVRQFFYLSAIGSAPDAPAEYSKTKYAAEELVKASGLPYTILRPSIILGKDGEFVAQMKDLIQHGGLPFPLPFPFIPVPGSGLNKFQPIYVDDLMQCIVKSLGDASTLNQIIEVGGATQVTFNALLAGFARSLGVKKPMLHAPVPILMLVAPLMQVLPNPPVTQDQLKNLSRDNTCDLTRMKQFFHLEPLSFDQSLAKIYGG